MEFFITLNRDFKHIEVVSNQNLCTNDIGIMRALCILHFSTKILISTHSK